MTDDELLLFHFSDGLPNERYEQIRIALEGDADLRDRLAKLRADLLSLKPADVEIPAAVQRRLQLKLQQFNTATRPPARAPFWQTARKQSTWLIPAFTAGAGALLMWFYTQGIAPNTPNLTVEHDAPTSGLEQTVSFAALRGHLLQTQALLESFDPNDSQERALLAEIITQNQNYAARAQRLGRADLARVLRALEPVLVEVETIQEPAARAGLIEQFEFEANSLQTKLQTRASKAVPKTI